MMYNRLIRLNLGCGNDILPSYVNHDFVKHRLRVDVAHDLQILPWTWEDDSAEHIRLIDVLEHPKEVVPIIGECWRLLAPRGNLDIRVPHYQSENAWIDPTHQRPFHLDTFDYFDPDTYWVGKYGFYTDKRWAVESKELLEGNVVVRLKPRKDIKGESGKWRHFTGEERIQKTFEEIRSTIPLGEKVITAANWVDHENIVDLRQDRIPFLQRGGEYWGQPADSEAAILELERLRQSGAFFFVFAWPVFWWLDYYTEFHRYLRDNFRCVLENDRLVVFDLRL